MQVTNKFLSIGMLSGLGDTIGRAIGNVNVTIFGSIDGIKAMDFWMYIFDFLVYLIFLIIASRYYNVFTKRFQMKVNHEPEVILKRASSVYIPRQANRTIPALKMRLEQRDSAIESRKSSALENKKGEYTEVSETKRKLDIDQNNNENDESENLQEI